MKSVAVIFAVLCAAAALANVPDVKGMYGWQLQMQFYRLGENHPLQTIPIACKPKMVKVATDCMRNGMFLTEGECITASGARPGMNKIDQVYSKPPAGKNDYYVSIYTCAHVVGPSVQS